MSCYDWVEVTAHRFDRSGDEPSGWNEAVAHMEGCQACRREALAIDPSLAFRNLAAKKTADEESILAGVRVLRRASSRRRSPPWRSVAAAAALAAVALWVAPSGEHLLPLQTSESVAVPYILNIPVVEAVDRPAARIYQLAGDDLSMVMIVDETLDV